MVDWLVIFCRDLLNFTSHSQSLLPENPPNIGQHSSGKCKPSVNFKKTIKDKMRNPD